MSTRMKPLTEAGSLNINRKSSILRPSAVRYSQSLNNFFLVKELKEYVNRFKWSGLPPGLNSNIIETLVYYKGQVAFFCVGENYYILPFVYTGQINHYGIQTRLIPISFNGTVEDDVNNITEFAGEREAIVYDKQGIDLDNKDNVAVVMKAGSSIFLNQVLPPIVATDEIRDKLAENTILVRYNLILSQPFKYVSVANESAAKSIQQQVDTLIQDILNGNAVSTIVGQMVFKDVNTEAPKANPQQLWQSFESLDNLRMEYLGILNNGVYEKSERNNTDEVAGKQTVAKLTLNDDLWHRKEFCKLVKKIFDLDIKVEINPDMKPVEKTEGPDGREGKKVKEDVEV